jgi:hypothetical protein
MAITGHVPFTVGGFIKATFIGALSGAVTFGVSSAVSSVCGFSNTAVGFWNGAIIGGTTGFFTGITSSVLNSVIKDGLIGAAVGGLIGGVQGGISAQKQGLGFWSGKGDFVNYFILPTNNVSNGEAYYTSTEEMKIDYNANIGAKDGMTIDQVEGKINTDVELANVENIPQGTTINNGVMKVMINGKAYPAAGVTFGYNDGGLFSKAKSSIRISGALKSYSIVEKSMVFKHEFMHAWHWNRGFNMKYSERATSSYSLNYAKSYGFDASPYRAELLGELTKFGNIAFPKNMSWRAFNNIVPTGL